MSRVERERPDLTADCGSCFGLCCVAHSLRKSAEFALDKPAGTPCLNLLDDFGCGIHGNLSQVGFAGCVAYTCFGAGQRVSQESFGGISWRQAPETAELMFHAFPMMRQLHELMSLLTDALTRSSPGTEHDALQALLDETDQLAETSPDELSWGDVDHHCRVVEARISRT